MTKKIGIVLLLVMTVLVSLPVSICYAADFTPAQTQAMQKRPPSKPHERSRGPRHTPGTAPKQATNLKPAESVENFLDSFRAVLAKIEKQLGKYAKRLFALLALIQFTYNMGMLLIRGQMDMHSLTTTLLRQIMLIGIFYFLMAYAPTIFDSIISSFRMAATAGGKVAGGLSDEIKPGEIYTLGVDISDKLSDMAWNKASLLGTIIGDFGYGLAFYISIISMIILLAFAVMTVVYMLALVKWYFMCTAAVLFLGFGGSEWSSDIAKNTFKSILSIGAEIFVILLIATVAAEVTQNWINLIDHAKQAADITGLVSTMASMSFILAVLTVTAPSLASGLISGSAIGAGGTAGAAAMAGGAAMAAIRTPTSMMARAGLSKAGNFIGGKIKAGGKGAFRGAVGGAVGGAKGAISGAANASGGGVKGALRGAASGAVSGAASGAKNAVSAGIQKDRLASQSHADKELTAIKSMLGGQNGGGNSVKP